MLAGTLWRFGMLGKKLLVEYRHERAIVLESTFLAVLPEDFKGSKIQQNRLQDFGQPFHIYRLKSPMLESLKPLGIAIGKVGYKFGRLIIHPIQEIAYFSDDDIYALGPDWYAGLFAAAAQGDLKGEGSTHYTKWPTHPHTIARMQAAGLTPRILYMIRNPVTRAVSHYLHEWSMGVMGSDPLQAFARHHELVDYGCYGEQIAPFVDAFGPENVCLTSLEQFTADPGGELARLGDFIGMVEPAIWQDDLGAQNTSADRIRRFPLHGLLIDNPVAAALRRTLIPKSIRTRIRDARRLGAKRPDLSPDLVARLEARFEEDRVRLSGLFPDHPALRLAYPFLDR